MSFSIKPVHNRYILILIFKDIGFLIYILKYILVHRFIFIGGLLKSGYTPPLGMFGACGLKRILCPKFPFLFEKGKIPFIPKGGAVKRKKKGDLYMELKEQINWLNKKEFDKVNPLHLTIAGFIKDGRDDQLLLANSAGQLCKMSIWGDNRNHLIKKLGGETDRWTGQKISIVREESLGGGIKYIIRLE